jgi:hypothetical protein
MVAEVNESKCNADHVGMGLWDAGWKSGEGIGLPGLGMVIAVVMLVGVEALLHSDSFMYRLRAVFAVGRASRRCCTSSATLRGGSSSATAGSITASILAPWHAQCRQGRASSIWACPEPALRPCSASLGVSMKEALLGPERIGNVLIGLDESLLQGGDALGYEVFFVAPVLRG